METHVFSENYTRMFTTVGITTDCGQMAAVTDVDTERVERVARQVILVSSKVTS